MASSIDASTSGAGGVITTADNTGILNLKTAGTTAVTVDASQNVGIGTTSPAAKLELNTANAATSAIFKNTNASFASDIQNIYAPSGTIASRAIFSARSDGTTWLTSDYGAMLFLTGTSGTTAERMRIDSSGNVLVGTTSTAPRDFTSGSGVALVPSAAYEYATANSVVSFMNYTGSTSGAGTFITFRQQGAARGSISTNGSTTAYNTSSDYRLKENIVPITGALDKVALLKPVSYTWKETGNNSQGFIAHELQAIVPDCVTGEKDAVETYTDEEGNEKTKIKPQGVDASFLVATLTAAIQEQQTIINDLKARITALEGAK